MLFPRPYLGSGKKNTNQNKWVNLILIHFHQIQALLFVLRESDCIGVRETVVTKILPFENVCFSN